jgi:hypothetical protein
MEIKHLHSFRAVAEELSFINASRKLHISQPSLSSSTPLTKHRMSMSALPYFRQLRAQQDPSVNTGRLAGT